MGTARSGDTGADRAAGNVLRRLIPIAALSLACGSVLGDLDRVVAIEIPGPPTRRVEEGDTLRLTARALSAAGEEVPGAVIVWELLDADTGQIGFQLDSLTGLITAEFPGSGRVRARVDELRSGELVVVVAPAPDSVAAVSATRLTVGAGVSESSALTVEVLDLTTSPGEALAIEGTAVHFELIDPSPASAVAGGIVVALPDSQPGMDPHRATGVTGSDGRASAVVRRSGSAQPDSAIVETSVTTARGIAVGGSPLYFVVIIENP
ncbi:MAG: hypothetical protein ACE5PT_12430 [Gemmatimonadales bacterium]